MMNNLLESDVWICLGSKRKLGQFEAGYLLRCLSLQRLTDGSYTSHFLGTKAVRCRGAIWRLLMAKIWQIIIDRCNLVPLNKCLQSLESGSTHPERNIDAGNCHCCCPAMTAGVRHGKLLLLCSGRTVTPVAF